MIFTAQPVARNQHVSQLFKSFGANPSAPAVVSDAKIFAVTNDTSIDNVVKWREFFNEFITKNSLLWCLQTLRCLNPRSTMSSTNRVPKRTCYSALHRPWLSSLRPSRVLRSEHEESDLPPRRVDNIHSSWARHCQILGLRLINVIAKCTTILHELSFYLLSELDGLDETWTYWVSPGSQAGKHALRCSTLTAN